MTSRPLSSEVPQGWITAMEAAKRIREVHPSCPDGLVRQWISDDRIASVKVLDHCEGVFGNARRPVSYVNPVEIDIIIERLKSGLRYLPKRKRQGREVAIEFPEQDNCVTKSSWDVYVIVGDILK